MAETPGREKPAHAKGRHRKRPNRSVFGPSAGERPDVLTDAETVMFPKPRPAAVTLLVPEPRTSEPDMVTAAAEPDFAPTAEFVVVDLPPPPAGAIEVEEPAAPGRSRRGWFRRWRGGAGVTGGLEEPYFPTARRTTVSRLILIGILCLQEILSLRLHNTAFEDEALYLYAGRAELEHLLHGVALPQAYATYFSGAPVLYPVAAAAINMVGGLALARMLSLAEMLLTTTLLYSITRRLFNEQAALLAAGVFAVSESVIFLGNFATYDATCLFLLAFGAWIVVMTADRRRPLFLLAAPVVALAVAVKYAGALFVPTIGVLAALAAWPALGRRALLRPVLFWAGVGALLYGGLRLGGPAYHAALSSTTTSRAQGNTPVSTLLRETVEWGGVVIGLAIIGTIAYTRRARAEPGEGIAPASGRLRRLALGAVLTGTAFLAPAYQAHLHTDVSFLKHIGFGLFFAAPMAGVGLARILGDHFRRPQIAIAVWCTALALGMIQSQTLYHVWPNSSPFVSTFARYLKPHAMYLVEVPEVPIYYLEGRSDAQPGQFLSTFYISYTDKKGQTFYGVPGFQAAIKDGYFQVVAYNGTVTPGIDGVIAQELKTSGKYYLAAQIDLTDVYGPVDYSIWVKGHKPAAHSAHRKLPAGRRPAG